MSMRLSRVIQHARQVRGRTCVGRLTPLRDGDFGYLFGHEAGNIPLPLPLKKWRIMQTSAPDRQSLHCIYVNWMSAQPNSTIS